jgi:hypothetical protein
MMTRIHKGMLVGGGAIALVIVMSIYLSCRDFQNGGPVAQILEPGWHFYPKPTTEDGPGTVFRIDRLKRRFMVDEIRIPVKVGTEVSGQTLQTMRTDANALVRFIAADQGMSATQGGSRTDTLTFEMYGVQREYTTDTDIADVLEQFRLKVSFRPDNKYYLIRESRSATELRIMLSDAFANALGGDASLSSLAKAGAGVTLEKHERYVINQKLPRRMRVAFLAEEIVPTSMGLTGKPEFDLAPLTEPLVWDEP